MTFRWLGIGNSLFCLQEKTDLQLPEWHHVGEVHLRQVYSEIPPRWYAIVARRQENDSISMEIVLTFESKEEAMEAVEREVKP